MDSEDPSWVHGVSWDNNRCNRSPKEDANIPYYRVGDDASSENFILSGFTSLIFL